MAKARKCDRCGRYYDENCKISEYKGREFIADAVCISAMNHTIPIAGFELCDACFDSFLEFLIPVNKVCPDESE